VTETLYSKRATWLSIGFFQKIVVPYKTGCQPVERGS